jgi:hypothetical protein
LTTPSCSSWSFTSVSSAESDAGSPSTGSCPASSSSIGRRHSTSSRARSASRRPGELRVPQRRGVHLVGEPRVLAAHGVHRGARVGERRVGRARPFLGVGEARLGVAHLRLARLELQAPLGEARRQLAVGLGERRQLAGERGQPLGRGLRLARQPALAVGGDLQPRLRLRLLDLEDGARLARQLELVVGAVDLGARLRGLALARRGAVGGLPRAFVEPVRALLQLRAARVEPAAELPRRRHLALGSVRRPLGVRARVVGAPGLLLRHGHALLRLGLLALGVA